MKWHQTEIDSEGTKTPRTRARRDVLVTAAVVFTGCVAVLSDPDRAFEWIAGHKEVQVDEFLTAVVIIGAGFAIFSWRRWTDLSRQVAEYKRLQEKLSTVNREASLLSETDDLLQSCLSSEEAYKVIVRHFEMQFPAMSGAILAIKEAGDNAEIVASWGQPAVKQNHFASKDCWGLRRGRINISLASDPRLACTHIGPTLPPYAMCVPMMAQGETLGILYLDTASDQIPSKSKPLTETEERTVKTLTEHLALAVANLNLRETLRTQAIRDPLTGLFNRRYMEESLDREFRRSLRKESPLAILMVDIDHFKQLNDLHGHEAGDAVLRELARLFQAQLRMEDIASRYGGEEFVLILPEADMTAASECGERLRQAIHAMRIQHYGQTLEGVTLSIGLACFPQQGTTVDALMRAVDAALYRAKENGRDRLEIA
jgi:diguanylate cyclase (GGDEF)-like protein